MKLSGWILWRLFLRELRRSLFPNDKDWKIEINKAKGKAKFLDGYEMSVTHCIPTVDGCFLRLFCHQNPAEDYSVTVFMPEAINCQGGAVKVAFSDKPHAKLFAIYKSGYVKKVGTYLEVTKYVRV